MFLLLNWLLGAGGSISSYGWVQLRVQQQMGAQKTGGQGREYRTKPAGGPLCTPRFWVRIQTPPLDNCEHVQLTVFYLTCFRFFSKMGIIMIIIATTSLKGLLKR